MQSWATEELKYAALPDKRLNQRLIKIVENLAQQPHASVPQASGNWANTKATYSFWKSKRIEFEDIIEAHQKQAAQRASKEKIILAIQDTSDFNFTHHQAKTWEKGFGMTCAPLICQRVESSLYHGIHNSRCAVRNFRPANMDKRTQDKAEEAEPEGQTKYSRKGK